MITFDEALSQVCAAAVSLPVERIALADASGRILFPDVIARSDLPRCDVSAMDGFACRREDLSGPMKVGETIPAGRVPREPLTPGQCARIMTGAMLPVGADIVVMFEEAKEHEGVVTVVKQNPKTNIRYQGEDIKKGTLVLGKGERITPAAMAMLASEGCDPVEVYKRPVVGIIATGDELVEPSAPCPDAHIFNSNSCQLMAQVASTGCVPVYFGIAPDNPEAILSLLNCAIPQCDVIIVSGGVSVGDFDFVSDVLSQRGITLHFDQVAVKPGKHTV